jgi:hypothetical protein
MAIASFCGMEICTGFAESCFSLLTDLRNYITVSISPYPAAEVAKLWSDLHGFGLPAAARGSLEARAAIYLTRRAEKEVDQSHSRKSKLKSPVDHQVARGKMADGKIVMRIAR